MGIGFVDYLTIEACIQILLIGRMTELSKFMCKYIDSLTEFLTNSGLPIKISVLLLSGFVGSNGFLFNGCVVGYFVELALLF